VFAKYATKNYFDLTTEQTERYAKLDNLELEDLEGKTTKNADFVLLKWNNI
jgi:hypothetical protein